LVYQELETKLQQANRIPIDGWQARVKVSFNCLEGQGVPKRVVNVNSVLNKTIVNLSIPDERNMVIPYEIKVMNIGSWGYERDINGMDEVANAEFIDFLFNDENTKLFFVNFGTRSSGYILVDHDGNKLFWPCRDFGSFKKGQFAELNNVFHVYWEWIRQNNLHKIICWM
jgi:hypothetical protein